MVRVEELIEDIESTFSMEDSGIDLRLIYNYSQLNAYGKMIMDKISPGKDGWRGDLSKKEQFEKAVKFKERCQKGRGDRYTLLFWALLILAFDDTDKEEHLSQICALSIFLGINGEEMRNLVRLVYIFCRDK